MRIKPLPREKAAIIILKRKGQSINNISTILGRSYSFIHKVLKNCFFPHLLDLRKLPNSVRIKAAFAQRQILIKLWHKWELFISGESERPP